LTGSGQSVAPVIAGMAGQLALLFLVEVNFVGWVIDESVGSRRTRFVLRSQKKFCE